MTRPDPSFDADPDAEQPAAAEAAPETDPQIADEGDDAPLNRAARRAKQRKQTQPSHVGPQAGGDAQRGRGPRSHSKRPR